MSIILHGSERSPPTRAVMITAKAIGMDIEVKEVDVLQQEQKSEAFQKMNPAHTIPTLEDNGSYIWESRAIMGYLIQKYGKDDKLYPKEPFQRAQVDAILHFDNASLYKTLTDYYGPQLFANKPPNEEKLAQVKDHLVTLERILNKHPYLAGDHLTIADISVVTSVSSLPTFGFSLEAYPKMSAHIAKIRKEIPFYEDLVKRGEEDMIILFQELMQKKK